MLLHIIRCINWGVLLPIGIPWAMLLYFWLGLKKKTIVIIIVAMLVFAIGFDVLILDMNLNPVDNFKIQGNQIIDKHYCDSSVFIWYGYYKPLESLILCFRDDGDIYMYSGLPYEKYAEFCKSSSKGKFYNQSIKGRYESHILYAVEDGYI